jgi:HD-like signal output (HDOD) protein/CheY-like chemotaxis protein
LFLALDVPRKKSCVMKNRILLVGQDQPLWRQFMQHASAMESPWTVELARNAPEARAMLDRFSFAAAVADVQLMDSNGLDLLDEIMRRQPKTLRIVLSDITDTENTVKCVGRGHHHLLKPCDVPTLLDALNQGLALESWLPSEAVQGLIAQMRKVPSPPHIYFQVASEVQSPDASVQKVGEIIAQDPAITAKVLQLANSALFGLQLQVVDPVEAIGYIGLETTKALVLLSHTFSAFENLKLSVFSVEALWRHSVSTGQGARRLGEFERVGNELTEQAFAAGLLHDIGKLLFAANMPGLFVEALALAREQKRTFWEVESQVLGACHSELGACLLGIWGLPTALVEAVALHHHPSRAARPGFSPLTTVHVANILEHEHHPEQCLTVPDQVDAGYLEACGVANRLEHWRHRFGLRHGDA